MIDYNEIEQYVTENIHILESKITIPMVEVLTASFFAHTDFNKNKNPRSVLFSKKVLDRVTIAIYKKMNISNTHKILSILKTHCFVEFNNPNQHKNSTNKEYQIIEKHTAYVPNENQELFYYDDIFNFEEIENLAKKIGLSKDEIIISLIDCTKKKSNNPDKLAGSRNNFTYKTLGFQRNHVNDFFDTIKDKIEVIVDAKSDLDIEARIKNDLSNDEKVKILSYLMWLNENKLRISNNRIDFDKKYKCFKSISKKEIETYANKNNLQKEFNEYQEKNENSPSEGYNIYHDTVNNKFVSYTPNYNTSVSKEYIIKKMNYIIQGFTERDADKLMHSKTKTVNIFHEELKLKWKRLFRNKHMKLERIKTIFEGVLTNEDLHNTTYYRIFEMLWEEFFTIINIEYSAQNTFTTPYGYRVVPDLVINYERKKTIFDAKAFPVSTNKQKKEIMNMREAIEALHEENENTYNKTGFFLHLDSKNEISKPIVLSNILKYEYINISVDFNLLIDAIYLYKTKGKKEGIEDLKSFILKSLIFNT